MNITHMSLLYLILFLKNLEKTFGGNYGYLNMNSILESIMELVCISLGVIMEFQLRRKM